MLNRLLCCGSGITYRLVRRKETLVEPIQSATEVSPASHQSAAVS